MKRAKTSREIAIDQVLKLIVEEWIQDDIGEAESHLEMAERYTKMTDSEFQKNYLKKDENV